MRISWLALIFSVVLLQKWASAQTVPNPNNFARINDVLPPAPNAAALGQYGGVEAGLSSGSVNKTIPLYTFSYRKISLPISVSYSTSGFKVDETASRVGHGWTLNAGGVISRTIHGLRDESTARLAPPAALGIDQASYDFLNMASNEAGWDIQPDRFTYNFNGYTGKFFFDYQNGNIQVVQEQVSPLKFETNFGYMAAWNFKVTTPDGLVYYFGGPAATEKTKKETTCGKSYELLEPTAWYLTQIESPTGETVNFTYEALPLFSFRSGVTQTLYSNGQFNAQYNCPSGYTASTPQTCQVFESTLCYNVLKSEGVYLKEISTSEGGKMIFGYTGRYDCEDKLLSEIAVWDYTGSQKFLYRFEYDHVNATQFASSLEGSLRRPFLRKIIETAPLTTLQKEHRFSYNDLAGLPVQLTMAQDHWGYFNGKNNSNLVEKPKSYDRQLRFPGATANRNPDYRYSQKGILSKIEYPTGGWDSIHYEANQYWGRPTIYPGMVSVYASVTGTGNWTQVVYESPAFAINMSQTAKLTLSVTASSGFWDSTHNVGTIEVVQVGGPTVYYDNRGANSSLETAVNLEQGKSYKLIVRANGTVITTQATLTYDRAPYQGAEQNIEFGGVRVAKVETYDGTGNAPAVKKFYYGTMATPAVSTAAVPPPPNYYKDFKVRKYCDGYQYCQYSALYSYSLTNTNPYPQSAAYQSVIEGRGENFEGGATEHTYRLRADFPASQFNPEGEYVANGPMSNQSRNHGKELSQVVYQKNASSALVPVKKVVYRYKDDERRSRSIDGYTVNRKYVTVAFGPGVLSDMVNAFDATRYSVGSSWEYVDQIEETTYDLEGQNPIVSTTNFYYDNETHQQLTRSETTNSRGEIISVVSKYPGDFAGLTASDVLTLGLKGLQDKGIIAPVVEKSIYRKNGDGTNARLLASTLTAFRSDNAQPSAVYQVERTGGLADFTTAAVVNGALGYDSRYQPQVFFEKYDLRGNLLQQRRANDVVRSYLWGYRGAYPVAEVVGADHAAIAGFVDQSVLDQQTLDAQLVRSELNAIRTNLAATQVQVSTLTFAPLIGVTSQTDANDQTTYFEYDALGRLSLVRDADNNILKKYCYNYYGQPELCGNLDPVWQPTGQTQCKPCAANTSYTSDILMREERDINPASPTYNEVRMVEAGTSSACLIVPDWQNTTKPLECRVVNGAYTGQQVQEQQDQNPCSPSYGTFRYIVVSVNCTACPVPANWQPTGVVSCEKNAAGNTGYQIVEEEDMESCSATFGTKRTLRVYNPTACPPPPPCSTSNCSGNDKKCVNGVCETGSWQTVSSVYKQVDIGGKLYYRWVCTKRYCFSDGTTSSYYTETYNTSSCPVQFCGTIE